MVLTYDDLRDMPEDGRRYEIADGELLVTPAPIIVHQRISRNLEFILHTHVTANALGEVLDAPVDVIFDRTTVLEPDLIFVARERMEMIGRRAVEGPPDLVVEIFSESTEHRDLGVKQQVYERYGVTHYWRVDPIARTLTELVLADHRYTVRATHRTSEPMHSALFPELAIDLATVFPPDAPP